jgi:SAM-dependent methyltransferase
VLSLDYPWLPADATHPVSCCLCGGTAPAEEVFAFTINGRRFAIRRCVADDLMYVDPQPGQAYAEALYNHPSYYTGEDDMYGFASTPERGREVAAIRLEEIRARGPMPRNFLEIGCGFGYTLEALREAGAKVCGVEFSAAAVAECRRRGVAVELATIQDLVPPGVAAGAPYDCVALYSVLEHVPDPRAFLRQMRSLLASHSLLVLRVPRSAAAGPWLSLVDHLWHFTPDSLRRLLSGERFALHELAPSGRFIGLQHGGYLDNMTGFARLAG